MTCNHHDSGRRCRLPADGTPYCTLHAVSPEESEVIPETTPGRDFEREVATEDATTVETPPTVRARICLHVENDARCQVPVDGTDFCDLHDPSDEPGVTPDVTPGNEFGCGVTKEDGTPCGAMRHGDSTFCIFHDPDYQEQRRLNSANGGRAPRKYGPRAPMQLEDIPVDTQSPAGIQSIITAVVALELTGQINPTRSRNILRALSVAARNLHINRPTEDDYYHHIGGVIAQIEECVQAAHENDAPPPKPPKLPVPLPSARARQSGTRTSYASASDYLNRLAAQYLNADD